jgi:hypothetical protein
LKATLLEGLRRKRQRQRLRLRKKQRQRQRNPKERAVFHSKTDF